MNATSDPNTSPASARRFDMQLDIAATPDAVWEAISTADGLRSWFAPEAEVTAGPGGKITWSWNDYFLWPQDVDVWEPGKRLRTTYPSAVDDGSGGKVPLFVDFTLEGRGDGRTRLRLVHSGFGKDAAFDEEYDGISRGWPIELRSLRLYLENHGGQERHLTWSSVPVAIPATEAWARLASPEGLNFGTRFDGAQEGDPFVLETEEAGTLEGTILHTHPQEMIARVANLGDAFLRFSTDDCGGTVHVWLWLATYGETPGVDLDGLQARWDAMLATLFPEQAANAQPERATTECSR